MWWIFRVLLSTVFLLSVVLSIPIAFDVGGRDAGLAYSLALFAYYISYSSIKIAVKLATPPDARRLRWIVGGLLRLSQWFVLPGLLIWALSRFSVDAGNTDWVARTVAHVTGSEGSGGSGAAGNAYAYSNGQAGATGLGALIGIGRPAGTSWNNWVFGRGGILESVTLGGWSMSLRYSSPVFQLLEGFCSLLVIQAAGQISRWLVNRGRSDTWVIVLLVFSGSVIASAVYFLWRVARFPQVDNIDATLIGVAMTSAVFLSGYGIGSGRGNPVESSLLFAYIVLCVYQIFTDYQPSTPEAAARAASAAAVAGDLRGGPGGGGTGGLGGSGSVDGAFPPFPPIIMASYSTLMHLLSSLPTAVSSALSFLYAAFQTITPSVIISLTYRIIVFYCATRIIPAVRESGARALLQEPSLEDSDAASKLMGFLSWFSASILIAVYTSLLLQHFSVAGDTLNTAADAAGWVLRGTTVGGTTWRWINVVGVMVLYSVEMYLGSDDMDGNLTHHWKMD